MNTYIPPIYTIITENMATSHLYSFAILNSKTRKKQKQIWPFVILAKMETKRKIQINILFNDIFRNLITCFYKLKWQKIYKNYWEIVQKIVKVFKSKQKNI